MNEEIFDVKKELEKRTEWNVNMSMIKHPRDGQCFRCRLAWSDCNPMSIRFTKNSGAFAVCTFCWSQSSEDELISYHKALAYQQNFGSNNKSSVDFVVNAVKETLKDPDGYFEKLYFGV